MEYLLHSLFQEDFRPGEPNYLERSNRRPNRRGTASNSVRSGDSGSEVLWTAGFFRT